MAALPAEVPVGGTAGLSHDHSAIDEAARWLAPLSFDQRPRPLVSELQQRFGLSAQEAAEAIAESGRILRRIDQAAEWLVGLPSTCRPRPIVRALQERFGLTVRQACAACRQAGQMLGEGTA